MRYIAPAAALLAFAAAGPVLAGDDDERYRGGLSRAEAADLAYSYGVDRIEEIERNDDEWEIEGRTRDGREIEIEIDARTGALKERDVDDDRDDGWRGGDRYDDRDDDDGDDDDDRDDWDDGDDDWDEEDGDG